MTLSIFHGNAIAKRGSYCSQHRVKGHRSVGHVIPALDEASFDRVKSFLLEQQGKAISTDAQTPGKESKL